MNANEAIEPEVVPEVKEEEAPVQGREQYIGAEIHIIADGKTGAISVNAPSNHVIALGLLEFAKGILADQRVQDAANANKGSRIIPAGADALKNLRAVS